MNLFNQNYHIQIPLRKLQLEKNKNFGCKEDFIERPLVNIYNFWNFNNRFLVWVGFKFLKLRCMLRILLKHLLFYLIKEINKNKYIVVPINWNLNVGCKFC